jgi:hypothetical protein
MNRAHACRCEACAARAGVEPMPTHTQAWRLECEARHLLGWPLEARRDYLARPPVQARRAALQAEMQRLFSIMRNRHAHAR